MKLIALLSSLLVSGIAIAQDVQSDPFKLVILSANSTLDGQEFAACHTGAAIESICLAGDSGSEFYFNTTKGSQSPVEGYEPSGTLVWNLPLGNDSVSEPMTFSVDPSTNVALPLFEPGYSSQFVTFGEEDHFAIFSYLDDTQIPPTGDKVKVLKNWYVCQSYYAGYQYQTLNWVLGNENAEPQNPSCVKVEVQRNFV